MYVRIVYKSSQWSRMPPFVSSGAPASLPLLINVSSSRRLPRPHLPQSTVDFHELHSFRFPLFHSPLSPRCTIARYQTFSPLCLLKPFYFVVGGPIFFFSLYPLDGKQSYPLRRRFLPETSLKVDAKKYGNLQRKQSNMGK